MPWFNRICTSNKFIYKYECLPIIEWIWLIYNYFCCIQKPVNVSNIDYPYSVKLIILLSNFEIVPLFFALHNKFSKTYHSKFIASWTSMFNEATFRENWEKYPMMGEVSLLDDGKSISRNIASLNILVHSVINLFY